MILMRSSRPSGSKPHDNTAKREQNPHYGHYNGLMMTGYEGAAIRDKAIIRDADLMRGRLLLAHRPGRSLHLPRNRRGERPRTMASPAGTRFPAGAKAIADGLGGEQAAAGANAASTIEMP
jgi:hypothetical protein